MLNTQRKLSLVEVQYIIVEVLTPTQAGIEKVQTEMDTDKSGNVDKSEAEQWWLRNCSRDLRAFERAWLAVVRKFFITFHHVSHVFSRFAHVFSRRTWTAPTTSTSTKSKRCSPVTCRTCQQPPHREGTHFLP